MARHGVDDLLAFLEVARELSFTRAAANPMLPAVLDGIGIAYLPEDLVRPFIDQGTLVQLLADWTPPFAGYHLYYPSRRQHTAAFAVLLETLRRRRVSPPSRPSTPSGGSRQHD